MDPFTWAAASVAIYAGKRMVDGACYMASSAGSAAYNAGSAAYNYMYPPEEPAPIRRERSIREVEEPNGRKYRRIREIEEEPAPQPKPKPQRGSDRTNQRAKNTASRFVAIDYDDFARAIGE